jgi:hypothetical protein
MAENTTVGPAGANKSALPAAKPANHNTSARDGRTGGGNGVGADASSATLTKVGELKPVNP